MHAVGGKSFDLVIPTPSVPMGKLISVEWRCVQGSRTSLSHIDGGGIWFQNTKDIENRLKTAACGAGQQNVRNHRFQRSSRSTKQVGQEN
jgi:hypothetical protein